MITSQGFGLIAELIAAALLIAALTGLIIRRSQPWLAGATVALVILNLGRDDNHQLIYLGSKFAGRDPSRGMPALPPGAFSRSLTCMLRSTGRTIYRYQDLRHSETRHRFAI